MIKNFFFIQLYMCVFLGYALYGMEIEVDYPVQHIEKNCNAYLQFYVQQLNELHGEAERIRYHLTEVRRLLECTPYFQYDTSLLTDALFFACKYGDEGLVKLLIALGADIDTTKIVLEGFIRICPVKMHPLCEACNGNYTAIVKALLDTKKINLLNPIWMKKPLFWWAIWKVISFNGGVIAAFPTLDALLSYVHEISNYQNEQGNTIFHDIFQHFADKGGTEIIIGLLLRHGIDVHLKNKKGQTPFQVFCKNADDLQSLGNSIQIFLNYHSDVYVMDNHKRGLLHDIMHFACAQAWTQEFLNNIHLLLEKGANPSLKDKHGRTPLHLFIKNCDYVSGSFSSDDNYNKVAWYPGKIVNALVLFGADVEAKDNKGNTPLHYAARHKFEEVVPMLLFHGAHTQTTNDNGKRAMDLISDDEAGWQDDIFGTGQTVALKNIFTREFVNTDLGQYCMKKCAKHNRVAALQLTGNPVRYLKKREMGRLTYKK